MCDQRVLCVCVVYWDILLFILWFACWVLHWVTELWDRRVPLRHIDRRVLQSYSLECQLCCMWYFGELTKLYAYRVMCYVFQVVPRIAERHLHDCTHRQEIVFMILGLCFIGWHLRLMWFSELWNKFYCVWKWKFYLKIYVVTLFSDYKISLFQFFNICSNMQMLKKTITFLITVCSRLVHLFYCRGLQRWSADFIKFCFRKSNNI